MQAHDSPFSLIGENLPLMIHCSSLLLTEELMFAPFCIKPAKLQDQTKDPKIKRGNIPKETNPRLGKELPTSFPQ